MSIYYLPEAEMPLTPKGYCDSVLFFVEFVFVHKRAEIHLTPKGYCDESFQEESLGLPFICKNQNNLKKLNNSKIYTTI